MTRRISIIAVVLVLFFVFDLTFTKKMQVEIFGNINAYSFEELIDKSVLIIQGKVLPGKENKLLRRESGEAYFGYTLTDIEVQKVFKGEYSEEEIQITEDYFTMDNILGKTLMLQGGYLPAKVGSSYIFF